MKKRVSPREFRDMLDALKAAEYLARFYLEHDKFEEAEKATRNVAVIYNEISNVTIDNTYYER